MTGHMVEDTCTLILTLASPSGDVARTWTGAAERLRLGFGVGRGRTGVVVVGVGDTVGVGVPVVVGDVGVAAGWASGVVVVCVGAGGCSVSQASNVAVIIAIIVSMANGLIVSHFPVQNKERWAVDALHSGRTGRRGMGYGFY